jgi:fructose-bisphosphate aldolase class II
MHGSSSVPQELQAEFKKYGGEMKETWGVPVSEIQEGIRNGVRKINIDTDNRLAMTAAIRQVLSKNPSEFDLRKLMIPARDAMRKLCAQRMVEFGQAGWASQIKPIPLDTMAKKYL